MPSDRFGSRTDIYASWNSTNRGCSQKDQCTRCKYRSITIHTCEAARQRGYAVAKTPGLAPAQRARHKVGALFGELKNQIGLRRLRLRRLRFVREQF